MSNLTQSVYTRGQRFGSTIRKSILSLWTLSNTASNIHQQGDYGHDGNGSGEEDNVCPCNDNRSSLTCTALAGCNDICSSWEGITDTTTTATFPTSTTAATAAVRLQELLYNTLHQIQSFPFIYQKWWIHLLQEDPVHVCVETILLAFVIYLIIVARRLQGAGKSSHNNDGMLSQAEMEELIREWKPEPLVPIAENDCGTSRSSNDTQQIGGCGGIIIHRVDGPYLWIESADEDEEDQEEMEEEKLPQQQERLPMDTIGCTDNNNMKLRKVLNMSSHDFLGMGSSEPLVKSAAHNTLLQYGCGSCGPRGFYGTIDVHLSLEAQISQFCNVPAAIMYSDGSSTCSSTIAAFAKRGDLVIVDEFVNEALLMGVLLSRANVCYFKHNDMDDLRRILQQIRTDDIKIGRKPSDIRRFIIVEGLYKNYGHVCPFDKLIPLKHEFSYRLIVDESYSFGTMGQAGRGALEHFHFHMMTDADIVIISLENSLASIGGICVGNFEVVDHQRLSGAGYCFSASAPPFVASAAIASLVTLQKKPALLTQLATNREMLFRGLSAISHIRIISDDLSPIAFVRLAENFMSWTMNVDTNSEVLASSYENSNDSHDDTLQLSEMEEQAILDKIVAQCLKSGVVIVSTSHVRRFLHRKPPPSFRMTVSAVHTEENIRTALNAIEEAIQLLLVSH